MINGQQIGQNKFINILEFVEGQTDISTFYQAMRENQDLRELLNERNRDWGLVFPWFISNRYTTDPCFTPLDMLNKLEPKSNGPGEILNIQGVLEKFLKLHLVEYSATKKYHDIYNLLLDAQPRWLDVNDNYLQSLLSEAPELGKTARKQWLRAKLLTLFRFNIRPPRWIQSPEWPFYQNRPMVFVSQAAIKKSEFFHDDGMAYIFYDPISFDTKTIIQLY